MCNVFNKQGEIRLILLIGKANLKIILAVLLPVISRFKDV
jgi:hypothetical protein